MSAEQETGSPWREYLLKAIDFHRNTGKSANVIYLGHRQYVQLKMLDELKYSWHPAPSAEGWVLDGKRVIEVCKENWLEVGRVGD